jgi:hypothetical protein
MSSVPDEPPTWAEPPDPDATAQALREQLAHAKARMQEHRDQMTAAGLAGRTTPEGDTPST